MLTEQLNPRFLERLTRDAIPWSRRQLQQHLEVRLKMIRQLVGRHYGANGAKERVPMNYIRMQTTILSRHLVSRSPRCMVEAKDQRLRALARATQQWSGELFDEMGLEKTLLNWNVEAILYPVGVLKVCTGYGQSEDGQGPDLLRPKVDNVDAERCVWDMRATRWDKLNYFGDRCFIPRKHMQGEGWDEERVAKLVAAPHSQYDEMGTEKTESISQDGPDQGSKDLYDDHDCWYIYLPREGLVCIFAQTGGAIDARPLYVGPHVGMKTDINCGPYHVLAYDPVPGNLLASPPVHAIFDLHEEINVIARKILRQARNQKTTLLVRQGVKDEARDIMKTPDMGVVPVTDPTAFNAVSFNGPNAQNMGALMTLQRAVNSFGGNFEVLGGLGVQAPTATQEELLASSSSKLVQFMQQESLSRTRELMRSVLWYEWHSRRDMNYNMPVEGQSRTIPWKIPASQEQGFGPDFNRYGGGDSKFGRLQFNVHPYSMRAVTPEMRVAQWSKLFMEIILPATPILQQQGYTVDVGTFAKYLAEQMDLPNFDEIVRQIPLDPEMMLAQAQGPGQMEMQRPQRPGVGRYTRTNVSGPEGQDQKIMAMMSQGDAA